MDKLELMVEFPKLASNKFEITSKKTKSYNCIAWAAGETCRKWWPDRLNTSYWPKSIPREATLIAFVKAYATLGYEPCQDGAYENGFEKVAIYTKPGGTPTHAARQLPNGKWTSKLGDEEDIEHELHGLEGIRYGEVRQFLRRPKSTSVP